MGCWVEQMLGLEHRFHPGVLPATPAPSGRRAFFYLVEMFVVQPLDFDEGPTPAVVATFSCRRVDSLGIVCGWLSIRCMKVNIDVMPHLEDLWRYSRVLTRDDADADDLVQEALARALALTHTYDTSRPLLPWLITIVRNTFLTGSPAKKQRIAVLRAFGCCPILYCFRRRSTVPSFPT